MTSYSQPKLSRPVTEKDHAQGAASAAVTLVEYGDFQCPHCGHAYPVVEALRRQMGDRLRFVFRNFPLAEIHSHAEAAAEAAEAAGAQGKFWEMHHALFTHQDALDTVHLVRYAKEIGIDTAKFTDALSTREFEQHVRADFMSGVRSGVNGTPTFFINGVRYDGPAEPSLMLEALQEAAQAS